MRLPPHVRWPLFVAGALALQVAASLATVYLATSDPSYAVEDDYYDKAVAWDARRAQDRKNAELGWRLEFTVGPAMAVGGQPTLEVSLGGVDGAPVTGAELTVETFHNARADQVLRARLHDLGGGRYRGTLPMRRPGVWELRFAATRGTDRFTHVEQRHLLLNREN